MSKNGKRYQEALKLIDRNKVYEPAEALEKLKGIATAKFNETVEIHVKLGVDPRKSDQNVRGTVVLPNGTGKTPKVVVFAKGEKAKDAEDAGADFVGAEDLIKKIKDGWMDFDLACATPDMMGQVGSNLGRVLGPRMPNPKAGTVSLDIGKTIKELKSGKVQYRTDKFGIIHNILGKVSFENEKILQNMAILLEAIQKAKPATAKGTYFRTVTLTTTMGPGIKIDAQKVMATNIS